jgi:hypothetical protein
VQETKVNLSDFNDWPDDIDVLRPSQWCDERLLAVAEACERESEHANALERLALALVFGPVLLELDRRKNGLLEQGWWSCSTNEIPSKNIRTA